MGKKIVGKLSAKSGFPQISNWVERFLSPGNVKALEIAYHILKGKACLALSVSWQKRALEAVKFF